MRKNKVSISACTIVKDEAANLGKWLANMRVFADELIVVDTGSTDGTQDIARAAGARLFSFPWRDDFAAAKNFAIDQARGNWIAFCDADETFREDTVQRVRPVIEQLHPYKTVSCLMCRLVNIDPERDDAFIGASVQIRLFRRMQGLRYRGAVHEALTVPKGTTVELVPELTILHTGYRESVAREKLARNYALLEAKVARQGGERTARDARYLMDCCYGLGRHAEAIRYAEEALAHADAVADAAPHIYMILASSYLFGKYPFDEVVRVMDRAIAACPEIEDFRLMKGLYLFDQHDYLAAEPLLRAGVEGHHPDKATLAGIQDSVERFLPNACLALGEIAALRGTREEAEAYYLRGLAVRRHHAALLYHLIDALRADGLPDTAIIELLGEVYDRERDAAFLVRALREHRGGSLVLYYQRGAHVPGEKQEERDIYAYLAAGSYDAAAAAASDRLAVLYRRGLRAARALALPRADGLYTLLPDTYRKEWGNA